RGIVGLVALERRLTLTRANMAKFAQWGGRQIGGAARAGFFGAGALGAAGLYKIGSSGIDFERYRTQLNGLEGSAAGGGKAMAWVTEFARSTPYELDEVMQAFIALKAYGIDPTDGSLRTLGDTAGGMGKSLMQAVEMMADAQTGEFERLKEFGVRASQEGEQVTFRFMKNGKEMTRTVKKEGRAIQAALSEIFNDRFAGGMANLAALTEGKWSNMMDRFTIKAKDVWERGVGGAVNRVLDRVNANLDRAEKDGSLDRWADSAAKSIAALVDEAGSFDWAGFASDALSVARAFASMASSINAAGNALNRAGDFASGAGLSASLNLPWIGEEQRSMNRRLLRETNRRLGWDENHGIPADQIAEEARQRRAIQSRSRTTRDWISRGRPSPLSPNRQPWRFAPAAPGFPRPGPAAPPPKGKVSVELRPPPGWQAVPTGVSATGMDLEVRTGRAMTGVA
ncbi:hypothetical protein P1X14_21475, partial [Sphingomonas sp. AOB5]|uniref:tape measure protein n=1 Tax=Sphingomonas sp. AOB5 TaxID=3034017 RepID=UPI0023F6768C